MTTPVALYLCRLCLNKTPTRVNIFGGDFPRMLDLLTSIKVHEEDGFPKYSCTKCAKEVQMAVMVKKRIIKAHHFLSLQALKKRRAISERIETSLKSELVEGSNEATTNEGSVKRTVNKGESSVPKRTTLTKQKVVSKPIIKQNKTQSKSGLVKNSNKVTTNEERAENESLSNTQKDENESTGFTCKECNLNFEDRKSFSLHKQTHTRSPCHICGRHITKANMSKHVRMHTAAPAVCPICGATFKNFEGLRCHNFHYHKHTAQQYICEECGKGFRMKHKLAWHKKKVHIGLKNFKCTTCGKAFFTNYAVSKHIRMTHEKQRPHVCEYCGTGFSSPHALKTHKRQHTNEKPFVCEHCFEGFRQRVSLRSHLKSRHGIEEAQQFFCKTCEKGFATDYALSIHERLHETENKCKICSENFAGDEFLANHLREVHQVEVEMKQDPLAQPGNTFLESFLETYDSKNPISHY
ncbi:zinc finger protein 718-like isoform X8 [Diabrotica virgifera virgifera]|uniref:Uncharacterized protein n=1 Tax=Diabrotica virgifera virgifera TaxID=50390 RepID=A0ABM5K972_DIAVI|nr:zinc finger protein 718-like isoform X8 [Diabrotica virgifera virgifera]